MILGVDEDWGCRCCCGGQGSNWWNKCRHLVSLFASGDVSLLVRGRLCSSSVRGSLLHGSGDWPVGQKNGVALWRAWVEVVRWMCSIGLEGGVPGARLKERPGLDDMVTVLW